MEGFWLFIELSCKIVGLLLFAVGWFATVREIFMESRGVGYLSFLFPVVPPLYASLLHRDRLGRQALLMEAGFLLLFAGIGAGHLGSRAIGG